MRSTSTRCDVLIVDDDPGILSTLGEVLGARGAQVATAASLTEARRCLTTRTIALVLTDLRMDGPTDGLEVARAARDELPDAKIVLMSGHDLAPISAEAELAGVDELLAKPLPLETLDRILEDLDAGSHPQNSGGARLADDEGQRLLELWLAGDEAAFNRLATAYRPMLYAIFQRWFNLDQDDADDLYQEVLLQLVRKAPSVRRVRRWLLGTAVNQAKKRIRRRIRDRSLAERYGGEAELTVPESDSSLAELVRRGLCLLKPADRTLLTLIYLRDLTYQETAEVLGRPIGSIGPLRGRALKRLTQAIARLETDPVHELEAA